MWKWFVFVTGISIAAYFLYVLLKGWIVVRNAPRADMFICPKGHGPLPGSALIKFMGEDFCPLCFHNKLRQAERGELK
jgi:hypothetical protein